MSEQWAAWAELLGFEIPADLLLDEARDGSLRVWRTGRPQGVVVRPELAASVRSLWGARGSVIELGGLDPRELSVVERLSRRGLLLPRLGLDPALAPSVSVVVPVRDRVFELGRLLTSVARQTYPGEKVETVVVDDGSSGEAIRRLASARGAVYVRLPDSRGPAAARNVGAAAASGDFVAFVDSDCVALPEWLEQHMSMLAERGVLGAAGRVIPLRVQGWLGRYEASESSLDRGSAAFDVHPSGPVPWVPACDLVVDRDAFLALGGFDERRRVGEDVDLCARLVEQGRLRYSGTAGVAHDHRTALRPFLERRFAYGTSEVPLAVAHPAFRRRVRVPRLRDVPLVLAAVGAGHAAPIAAFAAAGRRPAPAALAAVLLLVSGLRARGRRRAGLAEFLAAHALDELSYSAGRWVGALRARRPLHALELVTRGQAPSRPASHPISHPAGRSPARRLPDERSPRWTTTRG